MDNIGQRLDKAAELGGFRSRRSMCESLNIPYGTLNNWIKRNKIPASGILAISEKISISRNYLEDGKGSPYLRDESATSDYLDGERLNEMNKMYRELEHIDQDLIYQIIKRCYLRLKINQREESTYEELNSIWGNQD